MRLKNLDNRNEVSEL